MIDATTWKLLAERWPELVMLAAAALMGFRASLFTGSQFLTNRRVRKLMKLHAKKHEAEGAYLYDDSME